MRRRPGIPAAALLAGGFTSAHRDPQPLPDSPVALGPPEPTLDDRRQERDRAFDALHDAMWSEHCAASSYLELMACSAGMADRLAALRAAHEETARAHERCDVACRLVTQAHEQERR